MWQELSLKDPLQSFFCHDLNLRWPPPQDKFNIAVEDHMGKNDPNPMG